MLKANKIKVLRKIDGKTKIDKIRSNKSQNPVVSNLLMWVKRRRRE